MVGWWSPFILPNQTPIVPVADSEVGWADVAGCIGVGGRCYTAGRTADCEYSNRCKSRVFWCDIRQVVYDHIKFTFEPSVSDENTTTLVIRCGDVDVTERKLPAVLSIFIERD